MLGIRAKFMIREKGLGQCDHLGKISKPRARARARARASLGLIYIHGDNKYLISLGLELGLRLGLEQTAPVPEQQTGTRGANTIKYWTPFLLYL